eukprot:s3296_g1.t1
MSVQGVTGIVHWRIPRFNDYHYQPKVNFVESGPNRTCCILFNDLLLNYTVTPDLARCSPEHVHVQGTTTTTTAALRTCMPKSPTLEEAHLAGSTLASPFYLGSQELRAWSRSRLGEAEANFAATGFDRAPSSAAWEEEAVGVAIDTWV